MDEHHKVLFPAFLIIFASFLAFNMDNIDFSEPNYVVELFSSGDASPITGMVVVKEDGGSCATADNTVFGMYSNTNTHVAMFGSFENFDGLYCAQLDPTIATTNPVRLCDGNNRIGYVANGSVVDSGIINNAHFYAPETSLSNLPSEHVEVCYDDVQCVTRGACLPIEECLFSFEGEDGISYNAHAAECGIYSNQLCCRLFDGEIPLCGNGVIDMGEMCDGDNLGAVTGCENFDDFYTMALTCTGECLLDVSMCTGDNGPGVCGDDVINDGEMCDGDNWGNIQGCSNFGDFMSGTLSCNGCMFDTSSCSNEVINDSDDDDGDGINNIDDNCVLHPNAGIFGTCINNATKSNPNPSLLPISCSSDVDCINKTMIPYDDLDASPVLVEYCENSQDNEDGSVTYGDSCGNACDIDSSDANTCLNVGDQGGQQTTECGAALVNSDFDWNPNGNVDRSKKVEMILDLKGSNKCDGMIFSVQVTNVDFELGNINHFSVITPLPFKVENGIGKTIWYAENNNPGINPAVARWTASGYDWGTFVPPTSMLTVVASNSYCGDNITDSGEQCDDGNNEDDDGCSENCLNEGIDGEGSSDSCTISCIRFTHVCSADGSTVYDCGTWDSSGCPKLNSGSSCGNNKVCNTEFGNCVEDGCVVKNFPTVKSPSCAQASDASYVCGSWSDCINGVKIRECNSSGCNGGSCSLPPLETVACTSEPSVKGSFFDLWSLILAISILGIYYVFRKKN